MRPHMTLNCLSGPEIDLIHAGMLKILDNTGMEIQHDGLCGMLAEAGARVDTSTHRVRFSPAFVERFIEQSVKVNYPAAGNSEQTHHAGVYLGMYLNPETGALEPFTDQTLAGYLRLAASLTPKLHVGM